MVLDAGPYHRPHVGAKAVLDAGLFSGTCDLYTLLKLYIYSGKTEGKSPTTLEAYNRRVLDFINFLQQNKLPVDSAQVQQSHVKQYFYNLFQKELQASTIDVHYRVLRTFFTWLETEHYTNIDLMGNQKAPKVARKVVKPFTLDDIRNMLVLCSGNDFLSVRNRAMVLLFLDTGLRLAEVAGIQLADLKSDYETIKVMGKGAKERYVRLGRETQKAVYKYLLLRSDGFPCLWVTEERTPLHKPSIQILIRRLCASAGVRGSTPGPHTFRHTFATQALINGAGEFEVQSLLGHSTLTMTRRYTSSLRSEHAMEAHKRFSPVDNLKL